ncbi:MAG TPA: lipopolysaccharide assembly protein LapA domain-containing protein [Actinocrinis sp.]|nr:lipopolysaccharide assembly protein LapA domain-containing protein [Actinocrinis sp.]
MKKHQNDPTTTGGIPPTDPSGSRGAPQTANAPDPAPPGADTPPPTRPALDPPMAKPDRTRLGGLWIALTSGAVVLLLLLIFILENSQKIEISFFGAHGHLPLGVALLMAAIFGVLVVVIPGAGRMIQLRMLAKRQRARAAALPPTPYESDQPGTLAHHPDTDTAATGPATAARPSATSPNPAQTQPQAQPQTQTQPQTQSQAPTQQPPAYTTDQTAPNTHYHQ